MKLKYITALALLGFILIQGCKEKDEIFEDPYSGAKEALGLSLNNAILPSPERGSPGDVITVTGAGLAKYKDKIVFNFNGEKGDIVEITDTQIKVKVPGTASTGVTSISIDNQVLFGPDFTVNGLVNIDLGFNVTAGTNGGVAKVLNLGDGRYMIVGSFTNFNNKGSIKPINRIVRTFVNGDIDRSLSNTGTAANGTINGIVTLGNKYIIAGAFSGYNQRTENISNITSLNSSDGSIDTISLASPTMPLKTLRVPRFNGGTNSAISQLYKTGDELLAVGNFRYYLRRRYDQKTKDGLRDSVILDSTEIRQLVKLTSDGSLDKSYRFNTASNMGLPGANGYISTYMHTDGANADKLLVFGSFTKFDDASVPYILRLNPDGAVDNTFNVGTGANLSVSSATYNVQTGKYLLTGQFTSFGGKAVPGIVLINTDGSVDETFMPKQFEGGYPNYAKQLSDGKIVVSGSFKKYNNVTRSGFMILNAAGDLLEGYNATGIFSGGLTDIIETTAADGKKALLLYGSYNRFNSSPINNIVQVTIE